MLTILAQNAIDDLEEQFYEGQENRARILFSLNAKGLPVDVSIFFYQMARIRRFLRHGD